MTDVDLAAELAQRNAELALINSVQESIAGQLDQQAIYDLVGEKLHEVFHAQVVDIVVHDVEARRPALRVSDRARRSLPERDDPGRGLPEARDGDPRAVGHPRGHGRGARRVRQPGSRRRRGLAWLRDLSTAGRRRCGHGRHLDPEPRSRARLHGIGPTVARDDRGQPRCRAGERASGPRDETARRPSSER